jgi:hypothetical protein
MGDPYHLVSGPIALALVIAYEKTGVVGVLAFAAPPAFMMFSAQQYLRRRAIPSRTCGVRTTSSAARSASSRSATPT